MSAVEEVARRWHDGSDHARDGSPFGGHLCNCTRVAKRLTPMLRQVWNDAYRDGDRWGTTGGDGMGRPFLPNPYEAS